MINALALIAPLLSSYLVLRGLRTRAGAEMILYLFCLASAQIIVFGHILSCINRLGDVGFWAALGMTTTIASAAFFMSRGEGWRTIIPQGPVILPIMRTAGSAGLAGFRNLPCLEKLLLVPLASTVILLGFINLMTVVFIAPHHWDGITCHLARVAYYLQHGNADYFSANYWAHVTHPKNPSLALVHTYLVSGRNENLTQLPQFVSYWVAACGVYAICLKTGQRRSHGLFAAMIAALLVVWLMQATTTQIDLILSACFATTVYALFAFRESREWKHLGFAAIGIGLAIGTKATALLALPAVALVALHVFFRSGTSLKTGLRDASVLACCTLLAVGVFVLPAGYADNMARFGNPVGPRAVRESHSFEGAPIDQIARNGTKNLVRFGHDFLTLDGIPPFRPVRDLHDLVKSGPEEIIDSMGVDLEDPEATISPFDFQRIPNAHEDRSYWGVLGFGLVWPMVLLSLAGIIRSRDLRVLSLSAVVFLVCQAFVGPYDPWRGRYFTVCAVFAVPVVAASLHSPNRLVRWYLLAIVLAGCVSAVSAVLFRLNSPLVPIHPNKGIPPIFRMNRMEQLTRNRREFHEPLARFEQLVPHDACVAVCLSGDSFEYPLFGEHLTRTLIPINTFDKGLQPVPANAGYLVYDGTFPHPSQDDDDLGCGWRLRHLKDNR